MQQGDIDRLRLAAVPAQEHWIAGRAIAESPQPLAREEIFGPVLAVMRFKDEDEAIRLANAMEYGLAAAVWTCSLSRGHRMVRAIRAGGVHVNTYAGTDITVPLGGFKQSGFGRDKSLHALDKYSDLKAAWIWL